MVRIRILRRSEVVEATMESIMIGKDATLAAVQRECLCDIVAAIAWGQCAPGMALDLRRFGWPAA
ncbi:hypothetical protein GCM10008997_00580 [Halomonas salifodinae]